MADVDWNTVVNLMALLVGAVAAWAGAYAATRSEIRHLWRELGRIDGRAERAHARIDDHEKDFSHKRGGAR